MAASAIFITDHKGKPLIHRNYRGNIPISITNEFQRLLVENESNDDSDNILYPIIIDKGVTFAFVKHNDLYLLAVTKLNANAMLMLNFLHEMINVLTTYFDGLEQESIRDNFVLIYELLDEMNDFGYPQHTHYEMLKEYICIKEQKLVWTDSTEAVKAVSTITGEVPWRPDNIKYKKNEVFLDVIEKCNVLISPNGQILSSEILGTVNMKCYLSGMPELKLGLNDKIMMMKRRRHRSSSSRRKQKCVEMDDIRFHPCVRLTRFENNRTISFIPPDGEFELINYRLDHTENVRSPLIMVECHRNMISHSKIEYTVKCKSEFKRRSTANNVEILIPVPPDVDSPAFKTSVGKIEYLPAENVIRWNIKQFNGQKEFIMKASLGLPSLTANEAGQDDNYDGLSKVPIRVKFEIPYFTMSGIQVRYLKVIEKSGYNALPWVRYITQNGDYQIRM